jgi:hypothetical protein
MSRSRPVEDGFGGYTIMNRLMRAFLILPALMTTLIVALVLLPSVAFSSGQSNPEQVSAFFRFSPLPTPSRPGSTVPSPTPSPTRPPYPTATPTRIVRPPSPTPTQPSRFFDLARIDGAPLRNVIGDRLSSTLYAYTFNGRLYRSANDGTSWQLVSTDPAVDDFLMSAANPNVLYSGAGSRCTGLAQPPQPMYKSTDGGVNWRRLPAADNLRPLLAHPGDPNRLFAAGCDAPYLSTDGGLTWVAKHDQSPDDLWATYRVLAMDSSALVSSAQPNGATWGPIIAGGVAADGSGVVLFTNDEGDHWVRLTPNVYPASWGMTALAVDLYTEGLVAFAEPRSVWQTSNYGVNWQITSKGLETVAQRDLAGALFGLHDLAYHPSGRLYLATVRGLYVKPFTGQMWSKISETSFDNVSITNLLYTETNLNQFWLNTPEGVYWYRIQ